MKTSLPAFFRVFTPGYLEDRRRELPDLSRLRERGNLTAIAEHFHKLAGSGGTYGLPALSARAKAVERAAASDSDDLTAAFEEYRYFLVALELDFEDD